MFKLYLGLGTLTTIMTQNTETINFDLGFDLSPLMLIKVTPGEATSLTDDQAKLLGYVLGNREGLPGLQERHLLQLRRAYLDWCAEEGVTPIGNLRHKHSVSLVKPTSRGSSGHGNKDSREASEAAFLLQQAYNKAPDKPYAFWELFEQTYKHHLTQNEWTGEVYLDGSPVEIGELINALEDTLGAICKLSVEQFTRRLKGLLKQRQFNPVKEWLQTLPRMTAEDFPEFNRIAERVFGVKDDLSNVMFRKFMIGAVARAMQPGCDHRGVLILRGEQMTGKTTFFRLLAGSEWFSTENPDEDDHDRTLTLMSKWIIEMGELEYTTRKVAVEKLKRHLTMDKDEIRLKYDKSKTTVKRHAVYVGTANTNQLFQDTENTRFWVVDTGSAKFGHPDDKESMERWRWLKANRDVLWAVAYDEFLKAQDLPMPSSAWWLSSEESQQSEERNRGYQMDSPWSEKVHDVLDELTQGGQRTIAFKVSDLVEFLGERIGSTGHRQISAVISKAGFVVGSVRCSGHDKPLRAAYIKGQANPLFLTRDSRVGTGWVVKAKD